MALRRGFKSEASDLAEEVRGELGLSRFDRLDPFALARHLAVPVIPLSDLTATCSGAQYFLAVEPGTLSAVTVFEGVRRIVVHNNTHSPARQNSNVTHELAHGLLLHAPAPALDSATGCRDWNADHEEEADWLTGELLVTRPMALAVARGKFSRESAMERLGVSRKMLQWRINVTGAAKQAAREGDRFS